MKNRGREMTMFPAFPYFLKGKSIIMWIKNGNYAQIHKDESFFFLPPRKKDFGLRSKFM